MFLDATHHNRLHGSRLKGRDDKERDRDDKFAASYKIPAQMAGMTKCSGRDERVKKAYKILTNKKISHPGLRSRIHINKKKDNNHFYTKCFYERIML